MRFNKVYLNPNQPHSLALPPFHASHPQMHPLNRFRRYRSRNSNLLVWILHLKLKSAHHTGNRTPELCACKVLPDTGTLAMQESNLGEICRCPTIAVTCLMALLIRIDPTLGTVLIPRLTPEIRATVDSVRAQDNASAFGDTLSGNSGIANGLTDGDGDCGIQAKDLLADTVEEGHGLQLGPGDGMVSGRDCRADLFPEAGLDVEVLAELIAAPRQCAGGGLVLY